MFLQPPGQCASGHVIWQVSIRHNVYLVMRTFVAKSSLPATPTLASVSTDTCPAIPASVVTIVGKGAKVCLTCKAFYK